MTNWFLNKRRRHQNEEIKVTSPGGHDFYVTEHSNQDLIQMALDFMEGHGNPVRLPNNLSLTVSAAPMTPVKEWHNSVTADLRNHLVYKL